jgi:hypothetical protein
MGMNGRVYFKKHFDEDMLISELEEHFETIIIKNKKDSQ